MSTSVSNRMFAGFDRTLTDKTGYRLYLGFFVMYAVLLINVREFDLDMFHILQTGREFVTGQDIYHNLRCVYDNLAVIHQQWLYGAVIYLFYAVLGKIGISLFVLLEFVIFWLLFDRLCFLRGMSAAAEGKVLFVVMTAWPALLSARPWLFTMVCLLAQAICIEEALQFGRYKRLWLIPVVILISMNGRMALWPYHFAVYFAYFMGGFLARRVPFLTNSFEWSWRKMAGPVIASAAVLFVNPYTYRGVLYVFYSLAGGLHSFGIGEMEPAKVLSFVGVVLIAILCFLCFHIGKGHRIEASHALMFLCGFVATAAVIRHFVFVSFAASLLLCDAGLWKSDTFLGLPLSRMLEKRKHVFLYPFFPVFAMCFMAGVLALAWSYGDKTMDDITDSARSVRSYLEKTGYDGGVFTEMTSGASLEFEGVRCTLDSSPEEYIKAICGESGIASGIRDAMFELLCGGGLSQASETFLEQHGCSYACFFAKDKDCWGSITASGLWEEAGVFGRFILYRRV